ncbi:hypothetical protein GCM10010193_39660 [Kitasatospora atroaurantiaca]
MISIATERLDNPPSNLALASPFIVVATIALLSWALSKLIDRRVEENFSKQLKANPAETVALVDWAIDASQAAACIAVPILALENLIRIKSPPGWVPVFYYASSVSSLLLAIWTINRKKPLDYMSRLWFHLPPAASFGFILNGAACIVVLRFA